ncbi:MAG: hypothetical protein NTY36_02280 [Deltaproteobacteria bacterium]|nr:hypothetical protein [Deltaproteobacteria bacterium]
MPKQESRPLDPKQLEAQKIFLRYRWEFMRRDPEYIEAYQKAIEIRRKTSTPPKVECIRSTEVNYAYFATKEYLEESKLAFNFFLFGGLLFDPHKDFDDLIKYIADNMNFYSGPDAPKLHLDAAYREFLTGLMPDPVSCYPIYKDCCNFFKDEDFKKGKLFLKIDLNKVNSFNNLMELVKGLIGDQYYLRVYKGKQDKSTKKIVKKKERDYDKILQVGDLHFIKSNTHKQIAMEFSPAEFNLEKKSGNQESVTRRIGQLCDEYKKLINGGWRELQYP